MLETNPREYGLRALAVGDVTQRRQERVLPVPVDRDDPHLGRPAPSVGDDIDLRRVLHHQRGAERRPGETVRGPAEKPLGGRVGQQDDAGVVDHEHAVDVAVDQREQTLPMDH